MMRSFCLISMLLIFFCTATGQVNAAKSGISRSVFDSIQYGTASFYADKFEGRRTSSGEIFRQKGMTCAHNSLPLGTWVRITNIHNGKTVVVKVTDRMHRKNKRLVDLSKGAARALGYTSGGLTKVKLEILGAQNAKLE